MAADPIPPTAFDPGLPGAAFTPGDFYQAYLNQTEAFNASGGFGAVPGAPSAFQDVNVAPVIGPGGMELFGGFGGNFFEAPMGTKLSMGPDASNDPTQFQVVNSSQFLTPLEQEQLTTFQETAAGTEPGTHGLGGELEKIAPNVASIAAILGSAGVAGSVVPALLSTTGTLVGGKVAGPTGATVGGAVGGLAGGAVSGGAGVEFGGSPLGGAQVAPGIGTAEGAVAGGAGGVGESPLGGPQTAPSVGGIGGVGGGGVGAGSSLGTDSSTNQSIGGGGTGGAKTPGSDALGTGASKDSSGITASQVLGGINDLSTAAKLAQTASNLANPQAGTSVPNVSANQAPIGGAVPASQIAASAPTAIPTGTFQSATDDFARRQENDIRAQFANSNISGTPQEQRALQEASMAASQRSSAVQQAMVSAGLSDPEVFTALLSSGLQTPQQFQSAITQLRARGVV